MTDHELNKLLADVAVVKIWECNQKNDWTTGYAIWTPLTDHNQMAQVKAALRALPDGPFNHTVHWGGSIYYVTIHQYNSQKTWESFHADELRAFAEAVVNMNKTI